MSSVFYEETFVREYKNPEIFSHILGYVGKISQEELASLEGYYLRDYIGKMGLERFYDNFLQKKAGEILIERDSRGKILSEEIISLAEPGYNLELWLDAGLQIKLYEELKKVADQTGSGSAAAVAMDPQTGGVLAMVSLPGFDNNAFSFNDSEKLVPLIISSFILKIVDCNFRLLVCKANVSSALGKASPALIITCKFLVKINFSTKGTLFNKEKEV